MYLIFIQENAFEKVVCELMAIDILMSEQQTEWFDDAMLL